MFNKLKEKVADSKNQQQWQKLQNEAAEHLKGFDVSVSLDGMENSLDGVGKAVIAMENKANQKKAVVEFVADRPFDDDNCKSLPLKRSVNISIEGKEIFSNREADYRHELEGNTFSENIKSMGLPPKPYDAVYMMAVVAAVPEAEKAENKIRSDEEKVKNDLQNKEKATNSLYKKMVSDFLNSGHSN